MPIINRLKNAEIIVLHQFGAKSHYRALLERRKILFIELDFLNKVIKFRATLGDIKNLINFFLLVFSSRKKIICGIAPFSYHILFLKLLFKHHLYYHTSWHNWNDNMVPHKYPITFLDRYFKFLWEIFIKSRFKGIFTVSNSSRLAIAKKYQIPLGRFSVVNHSFDAASVRKKVPFSFSPNKFRIIYCGRLEEQKGLLEVLELAKYFCEIEFIILGSGSLTNTIIREAKLRKNIKYIGFVEERTLLYSYMKNCDILLNLSKRNKNSNWEELFGISIIEGLACGLSVISTSHVGPIEIINHGFNGFLIDEVNIVRESKEIIKRLVFDPNLRKEISKNAIESSNDYDPDRIYLRWNKFNLLD